MIKKKILRDGKRQIHTFAPSADTHDVQFHFSHSQVEVTVILVTYIWITRWHSYRMVLEILADFIVCLEYLYVKS